MKSGFYVALMLSAFFILGNVSTVRSTSIGGLEPDPWERTKQAQITKASSDLISVVGNEARIIAIKGNVVTLQSLSDKSKTSKVTVNNTSLFTTGQEVKVTGKLLAPK
jgi:hypothetical protein